MAKRTTPIEDIANMCKLDEEDVSCMLLGMHISPKRFLEIANIHKTRTVVNLACGTCEHAHDCAWYPMLRYMLTNYMDKDTSSLQYRKDYRNG